MGEAREGPGKSANVHFHTHLQPPGSGGPCLDRGPGGLTPSSTASPSRPSSSPCDTPSTTLGEQPFLIRCWTRQSVLELGRRPDFQNVPPDAHGWLRASWSGALGGRTAWKGKGGGGLCVMGDSG